MNIRGAASPEGPYSWNKILSERRMNSLLQIINDNSNFAMYAPVKTFEVPEDYIYLLRMMKENNDQDYDRVAAIVNKYIDSDQMTLKKELMQIDGRRLWYRLLRQYFPAMRAARVVLIFRKNFDLKAEELKPVHPLVFEKPEIKVPDLYPMMTQRSKVSRRELLSIKTNLLFDLAYVPGYDRWCPIPNVAIEYYPLHGHFTYGASFDFPWWQDYWAHKYFQIRNYQLEARYYLKETTPLEAYEPYKADKAHRQKPAFYGWYLQAYLHGGLFDICFDENRGWEGEGIGAGVGLGYVLPISRNGHWRLEFGLQAGYFRCKYDPYQFECPVDPTEQDHLYYYKWYGDADQFKRRQYRYNWLGPTRIGVTLTYDLLYRKRNLK